ncbi:MAG: hypothetical protein ABWZ25_08045 [Chitinophagaceae bacterium]
MKKLVLCLMTGLVIATTFTSCSATKKDCQGVRHTKQKGGFYM